MEYSEQRLNSLAARLRNSDHEAATELVDLYSEQIYLFMRRFGHSRQVSEDLTQESFISAWQHISQLRSDRSLNSWMYRIASNVSKHHWRKHKSKKTVSLESLDGFDISDDTDPDKNEYAEELSRLKNGIAKLPLKLREVIILHYMQHLTISEAAQAAGVREGTFKSRLNRALEKLRKQLH